MPHDTVEQAIEDARSLQNLAALAIFDDDKQGGNVYSHLNNKLGRWAGDAFRAVKEGAHGNYNGAVDELIRNSEKIAHALRYAS